MKKISSKNISSSVISDFLSSSQWIELNSYNKKLDLSFFKKSEFLYLLIYRFIGGVPWQLSCLLPTIFNVKTSNFFFATLVGIIPQIF